MNSSIQLLSGTFWNVLNHFVVACVGLLAKVAGILHMQHLQDPGLPFYHELLLLEKPKGSPGTAWGLRLLQEP